MIIQNKKDVLREARRIEGITWFLWERWKDSPNPKTRRMALAAKAHGICAFDRLIRAGEHLA